MYADCCWTGQKGESAPELPLDPSLNVVNVRCELIMFTHC